MERRNFVKATTLAAAAGAVSMTSGCKPPGTGEGSPSDETANQPIAGSLDAIFAEHMEAELAGDLDKTMATMTPNPHIVNIPTMIGGQGPAGVRQFYANRLIGQFFPEDVQFETISETASAEHLVTEMIISFTHTIEMDHILPGVKPTGKFAEVVFVVIVGFKDGKVEFEHIHWDQANLLVQLGLIDPAGLPLTGAGAAAKLRDPSTPDPFFSES
ncbi:MAG: carboxymethylenebutenolidase [Planctomycetota bacterium]|jgi:carboxymethylenebutenolidase